MKVFGNMKLYLLGPELSIDDIFENIRPIAIQNFILEDEELEKVSLPRPKRKNGYISREARRLQDKKVINKFYDDCCIKVEASYVTSTDLYEAYVTWIASHHAGRPVNLQTFGKYLGQSKKVRCLRSKAMNNYQSFYPNLMLKDASMSKTSSAMGEMYRFYKSHFFPVQVPTEKIALDNIYALYLSWCLVQDVVPLQFHSFSKLTRLIMGSRHLIFLGKSPKGGSRRWLTGFKFNQPIPK